VIDAEYHDQNDFGDEQQAEEKGQAAQCLGTGSLEKLVIGRVDQPSESEEDRGDDNTRQYRIDAEGRIQNKRAKSRGDNKGRVGDVDRIEQAETDRQTD
jgi:hypothetical protein